MAKRDTLGGGSRLAPNPSGPNAGLNAAAPATQGTDPSLPNQGWGEGAAPQDQGAVRQAKDEAKNLAAQAKNETRKIASQAKDQMNQVVAQRKDEAAQRLDHFANALRDAGHRLQEEDESGFGNYADRAAQQVERLSHYLRDRDVSTFLRDTEDFARRHPDVFLGGAFLAGLVLARFFKASAPRDEWDDDGPAAYAPYGEARPYTTERYPGTEAGDALAHPRPFEATGV
jgi:hypothetical protein